MSALFKTPKMEKPPSAPTFDDARTNLDVRRQLAGRKGRAANIIAGSTGASTGAATGPATKVLLGQ